MRVLKLCLTYSCPFKCYFCYNKSKSDDTTILSLKIVDSFLHNNHDKFDKVVISGGEPTLLLRTYLLSLIEIIKKYTKNIELETYPIVDTKLFNEMKEVQLKVSYDITARNRANEVWRRLLTIDRDFDLVVTLSPIVFRLHPNKILQTLNQLPKLKSVIFKPFYNNQSYMYNIKNEDYKKFVNILNNSKLNLRYAYSYGDFNDEFILNPYGKLFCVQFDNDVRIEKEISEDDINDLKTNHPKSVIV